MYLETIEDTELAKQINNSCPAGYPAVMSSPIPLLLFGKIPTHIKATKDVVKPEFEGKVVPAIF